MRSNINLSPMEHLEAVAISLVALMFPVLTFVATFVH